MTSINLLTRPQISFPLSTNLRPRPSTRFDANKCRFSINPPSRQSINKSIPNQHTCLAATNQRPPDAAQPRKNEPPWGSGFRRSASPGSRRPLHPDRPRQPQKPVTVIAPSLHRLSAEGLTRQSRLTWAWKQANIGPEAVGFVKGHLVQGDRCRTGRCRAVVTSERSGDGTTPGDLFNNSCEVNQATRLWFHGLLAEIPWGNAGYKYRLGGLHVHLQRNFINTLLRCIITTFHIQSKLINNRKHRRAAQTGVYVNNIRTITGIALMQKGFSFNQLNK